MSKSRYFRPFKTHFRDRKRKIVLPGADEESGKWIKCHVCGFHINLDELSLTEGSGDIYKDFEEENLNLSGSGNPLNVMSIMDNFDMIGVGLQLGDNGNPITTYNVPRTRTVGSGCKFCGSTNF